MLNESKNVIIIDDDPSNNILCKAVIRRVFPEAEMKAFLNASAALEYIAQDYVNEKTVKPATIFLDINMPILSGWEFLDEFKNFPDFIRSQFKIYMLSSSIDLSDKERAGANEFVEDFISKPLRREVLVNLFNVSN